MNHLEKMRNMAKASLITRDFALDKLINNKYTQISQKTNQSVEEIQKDCVQKNDLRTGFIKNHELQPVSVDFVTYLMLSYTRTPSEFAIQNQVESEDLINQTTGKIVSIKHPFMNEMQDRELLVDYNISKSDIEAARKKYERKEYDFDNFGNILLTDYEIGNKALNFTDEEKLFLAEEVKLPVASIRSYTHNRNYPISGKELIDAYNSGNPNYFEDSVYFDNSRKLLSDVTFLGRYKKMVREDTNENIASRLTQITIDIDNVDDNQIINILNFVQELKEKNLPYPHFIKNSGSGIHLIYLIEPVRIYHPRVPLLNKLKNDLINIFWQKDFSKNAFPDTLSIAQGYAINKDKYYTHQIEFFYTNQEKRYSLYEINSFVSNFGKEIAKNEKLAKKYRHIDNVTSLGISDHDYNYRFIKSDAEIRTIYNRNRERLATMLNSKQAKKQSILDEQKIPYHIDRFHQPVIHKRNCKFEQIQYLIEKDVLKKCSMNEDVLNHYIEEVEKQPIPYGYRYKTLYCLATGCYQFGLTKEEAHKKLLSVIDTYKYDIQVEAGKEFTDENITNAVEDAYSNHLRDISNVGDILIKYAKMTKIEKANGRLYITNKERNRQPVKLNSVKEYIEKNLQILVNGTNTVVDILLSNKNLKTKRSTILKVLKTLEKHQNPHFYGKVIFEKYDSSQKKIDELKEILEDTTRFNKKFKISENKRNQVKINKMKEYIKNLILNWEYEKSIQDLSYIVKNRPWSKTGFDYDINVWSEVIRSKNTKIGLGRELTEEEKKDLNFLKKYYFDFQKMYFDAKLEKTEENKEKIEEAELFIIKNKEQIKKLRNIISKFKKLTTEHFKLSKLGKAIMMGFSSLRNANKVESLNEYLEKRGLTRKHITYFNKDYIGFIDNLLRNYDVLYLGDYTLKSTDFSSYNKERFLTALNKWMSRVEERFGLNLT